MREGSYTQIEPGMRVIGSEGETLGAVGEVIADEASGIFVGLAVQPPQMNAHVMKLRGEFVDRVHDGLVYVNAREGDLEPYRTVTERHHDAEKAYDESTSRS